MFDSVVDRFLSDPINVSRNNGTGLCGARVAFGSATDAEILGCNASQGLQGGPELIAEQIDWAKSMGEAAGQAHRLMESLLDTLGAGAFGQVARLKVLA
jgi:hypothetical protein